ncbi:stage III sporulation protein AE [Cohnella algarum]|uniref:stage III sporulation protein AE n=1 Tax=Cohnella algarum TaxID=2044859 RepID=UPI0019687752|nr:stage III sporulation protein AE [Cohnella algarum]MBN2984449.1 stage III sporulation protein AE [Cohnella algarum]
MRNRALLAKNSAWAQLALLLSALALSFLPHAAQAFASSEPPPSAGERAGTDRLAFSAAPAAEGRQEVSGQPDAGELAGELAVQQSGDVDMSQIEQFWNKLGREYGGYFPEGQIPELSQMMFPEGKPWSVSQALGGLARYFLHELLYSGKLVVTIVLLAVFAMILETMQNAFERNAVSRVAYSIAYIVLLIIAVNSFRSATAYAEEAISGMVQFMLAMVPLLLTLLAGSGGVTTVAVMHPLIVFMIHSIGTLIHLVVFPLLFFSAVLHLASAVSDRYKVTQLANLLRSVSVSMLGILLTLFLGVLSVQGATGAVADGIVLKTTKFVTGNFVPVVGRMFSDAADTVLSASLLVKNAVGLTGVIILLFLCAFPAIKILTLALIYNLSAAVLQPLGDSPIAGCLQTIGKTLIYVFAALASVGLMFFLAVTIILTAGNASVMLR